MIIGLTGGIASGKSTVSSFFQELGVEIVDADKIVKEISQEPDNKFKIIDIFGDEILDNNGEISREKLRKAAFRDKSLLHKLNALLHPQVIEHLKEKRVKTSDDEIVIFDIPLLYEAKLEYLCDKIIVVGVDREIQIKRLMERDDNDRELALKIISHQMPLKEKFEKADIKLINDKDLESLREKVKKIYRELKGK